MTVVVEDTDYTGSCAAEVVANSTSGALAGEYDLEYCQPNTDYIFNFLLQLPSPGSPAWKPISVNAGLILSSDR
ncbi:MAG TPA: hypothetical protein VK708_21610, partial [Bryobacteraceae bacterium]|nr:hypothetical protein [Bryobacteraceae bacterium]